MCILDIVGLCGFCSYIIHLSANCNTDYNFFKRNLFWPQYSKFLRVFRFLVLNFFNSFLIIILNMNKVLFVRHQASEITHHPLSAGGGTIGQSPVGCRTCSFLSLISNIKGAHPRGNRRHHFQYVTTTPI